MTVNSSSFHGKAVSNTYQRLADIVILTSLAIAACSLAIIVATFPVLRLITGPEVARNE